MLNVFYRIFIGVVSLSLISAIVLGFTFILTTIFGDAHIILRVIFGIMTVILIWTLGDFVVTFDVTDGDDEEDGGERNRGSDED